jgi:hypothetical protein
MDSLRRTPLLEKIIGGPQQLYDERYPESRML